ncbi:MAG: GNAT family N-acetyltransferase [Verrucomicrobiota bacterium]
MGEKVVLETQRLYLREMTDQDFGVLFEVLSDPETMRYYPTPYTEEKVRYWIDRFCESYVKNGFGLWIVVEKETGVVVGDCGLILQSLEGVDEVEIGYHFNKKYWGRGYATEAAAGCRQYAFEELGLKRVISLIRPENKPSWRVAERNGMKIERELIWWELKHRVYVSERGEV